jgi:hypothetical protein
MNRFEDRYLQYDLARSRVFDKNEIQDLLQFMQKAGYNGLALYLEASFAFESIEGIIRPGVMTPDDAAWLVDVAGKRGIKVMPMTNLFGHMEQFVDRESYAYLSDQGKGQVDFTSTVAEDFAIQIANEYSKHFKTDTVHIGADETELDDNSRPLYAAFLARVCRRLLDQGIIPAIWSDMLWMHPELVTDIPRECIIFDWNYYGHRPDSLKFWKEHGFEKVLVCPADQSWEGFITCYRTSGHLKATMDPIGLDEVEAFLVDGFEFGTPGACLTTWEHRFGNSFWSQLVPMARAGLYISGQWTPGINDEAIVEHTIFGRTTPYSAVTKILRENCQAPLYDVTEFYPSTPRTALYLRDALVKYLINAPIVANRLISKWKTGIQQAESTLGRWTSESKFEDRCLAGMRLTCSIVKTSLALLEAASAAYEDYHTAAMIQFQDTAKAIELLNAAAARLDALEPEFASLEKLAIKVISTSGHPRVDQDLIPQRMADISWLAETIRTAASDLTDDKLRHVNILSWRRIINKAILNEPVWGFI